jgi:TonB family protein
MKLIALLVMYLISPLAAHCQVSAQTPAPAQMPQPGDASRYARVKPIFSPFAPYPEEALKKGIEGTVLVTIDVDSQGLVTNVVPASGPPELFQAAIDSAKQWKFNPPENPPIQVRYEIKYGYDHECPGPISTQGEIIAGGRLETANGLKFSSEDIDFEYLLWYFNTKVRKTGVAGEIILAITADADGRVKKVRVVKSLSPELDKVTVKSARKWKFKVVKRNENSRPGEFELPVTFTAYCCQDWEAPPFSSR